MWRVHDAVGDGTVITAVLLRAALQAGLKLVTAGYNPMRLRHGIEQATAEVCAQLKQMSEPLQGQEAIARMAQGLCNDPEMAALLGEVFDIVGWEGAVEVRDSNRLGLEREYVEGAYWKSGWLSPGFVKDGSGTRVELSDTLVLVSDLDFTSTEHLLPVLEAVLSQGSKSLFIVARDVSGSALSLLLSNLRSDTFTSLAVKYPGYGEHGKGMLSDIAALVGARVLSADASDTPARITAADLGRARLVWADRDHFGIVGGGGDARKLRAHIANARAQLAADMRRNGEQANAETQMQLRERVGKLMGGVAVLYVGGATQLDVDLRKALAERAVMAVRSAVQEGIVPGGGAALVACQSALDGLPADAEERAGIAIVRRALEEPLRAIAENAGYSGNTVIAQLRKSPAGWGFDVISGSVADLRAAGVWDARQTLEVAVRTAFSAATLALTTQTLVHRRKPEVSVNP